MINLAEHEADFGRISLVRGFSQIGVQGFG